MRRRVMGSPGEPSLLQPLAALLPNVGGRFRDFGARTPGEVES